MLEILENRTTTKRVHHQIDSLAQSIGVAEARVYRAIPAHRSWESSIIRGVIADEVRLRRSRWYRLSTEPLNQSLPSIGFGHWESLVCIELSGLMNRPIWDCEAFLAGYCGLMDLFYKKGLSADSASFLLLSTTRS